VDSGTVPPSCAPTSTSLPLLAHPLLLPLPTFLHSLSPRRKQAARAPVLLSPFILKAEKKEGIAVQQKKDREVEMRKNHKLFEKPSPKNGNGNGGTSY